MFIGHYAVGIASKKLAPGASLGVLIAAPILLDLLWPTLLLLKLEHVAIIPSNNPFLRFDFISYPISHGLIAAIGWATLFASLYLGFTRQVRSAMVIWFGVLSHWLLDFIVHRRDLPLYAGGRLVGLGLWNYRAVTIAVELVIFAGAILIYLLQTKARDKIGTWAFWLFVVLLLVAYGLVAFGPPPSPSAKAIAIGALATVLLIPWAWWLDRHREARAVDGNSPLPKVTLAGG